MYVEAQKAQLASDANGVKWDDPDIAKSLDLITEYYGAENSQKAEDVKKEISEHNVQTLEEIKRENGEIFDSYLSDTK
ncbi:MAG: hypothetical protein Q8876_09295, partial [Bacillota bacterium]|nr:hypothetical protein [Bacillota bacterium]